MQEVIPQDTAVEPITSHANFLLIGSKNFQFVDMILMFKEWGLDLEYCRMRCHSDKIWQANCRVSGFNIEKLRKKLSQGEDLSHYKIRLWEAVLLRG